MRAGSDLTNQVAARNIWQKYARAFLENDNWELDERDARYYLYTFLFSPFPLRVVVREETHNKRRS